MLTLNYFRITFESHGWLNSEPNGISNGSTLTRLNCKHFDRHRLNSVSLCWSRVKFDPWVEEILHKIWNFMTYLHNLLMLYLLPPRTSDLPQPMNFLLLPLPLIPSDKTAEVRPVSTAPAPPAFHHCTAPVANDNDRSSERLAARRDGGALHFVAI